MVEMSRGGGCLAPPPADRGLKNMANDPHSDAGVVSQKLMHYPLCSYDGQFYYQYRK